MLWCYGGVIGFEEMTATGMTGEEVFKKIDKDGNGKVNRAELQVVLEEVGFTVTPSLLTNVMLRFTRYVEEKRGERDNTLCAVCAVCCMLCVYKVRRREEKNGTTRRVLCVLCVLCAVRVLCAWLCAVWYCMLIPTHLPSSPLNTF